MPPGAKKGFKSMREGHRSLLHGAFHRDCFPWIRGCVSSTGKPLETYSKLCPWPLRSKSRDLLAQLGGTQLQQRLPSLEGCLPGLAVSILSHLLLLCSGLGSSLGFLQAKGIGDQHAVLMCRNVFGGMLSFPVIHECRKKMWKGHFQNLPYLTG